MKLKNKFQTNFNQNQNISIKENPFQNVIYRRWAIIFWYQYVDIHSIGETAHVLRPLDLPIA